MSQRKITVRILVITLLVLLVAYLAGCGGQTQQSSSSDSGGQLANAGKVMFFHADY
ncbi:MAG: hypothetical protein QME63_09585 [Actinomycetota bacterium]|nr:hypothetical protein [Actinomycetota bacterium]